MTKKQWQASAVFIDGDRSTGTQKYEAQKIELDDKKQKVYLINGVDTIVESFDYDKVMDFSVRLETCE